MIQNTNLSDAQLKIADYLKTDANIKSFCNEQFNKEVKVYAMDMLRKRIPTAKDAPYIVVFDFAKLEGLHVEFARYTATIVVGVSGDSNKSLATTESGVLFDDTADVCGNFMTLVQQELNVYKNKSRPLARCETSGPGPIEADGSHFAGFLKVQWRIYPTLGGFTEDF